MLRIKKDTLFLFIKSLTKTEIKYYLAYSRFTAKENKSNYLSVFKLILNQKEYKENEIIKEIKSNKLNFFVLKSNLYYHILKALRSYNSALKPDIIGYMQNASILFEKNMPEQAEMQLNIAEKKAISEEKIELLPEIYNLKSATHIKALFKKTDAKKLLKKFLLKSEDTIKSVQLIRKCQYYKYMLGFHALQEGRSKMNTDKIYAQLNKIEQNKLPTIAHIYYLEAIAYYYYAKQKFVRCEISWYSAIKIFEKNKYILEKNIEGYIDILYNLLYVLLEQGIFNKKIPDLLDKLHQTHLIIKNNTQLKLRIKNEIYQSIITVEIDYYLITGQHKLALEKVKQCKIDLSNNNLVLKTKHAQIIMEALFVQTHFMHKEYDLALAHITFITKKFKNIRIDWQCQMRIFSLIIHFEKKNYVLLENRIRTAKLYTKKRNGYSESMKLIVNYIQDDINSIYSKSEKKEHLIILQKKLIERKEEAFIKHLLLLEWVESKLTNEPIDKILQKKTKENSNSHSLTSI